ncbi:hypothetical protein [Aeromicrobium sp. CTD01-1L150]|uniref:hypothetical protein n=1 Tax=Aeromicrobium sp. CTD01-1L150 TaxID=3341830 RepID=UPI0035C1DCF1
MEATFALDVAETKHLVTATRTAKELPDVGEAASTGRGRTKQVALFSYGSSTSATP